MMSDKELATRVAVSNDQAAFTTLVERHQAAIRGFLRRLVAGDHAAADDLAQETFLAAYRKLHTWRGSGSLASWLHSIAYRQFLDLVRKSSRQQVMAEVPDEGFDERNAVEAEILVQKLLTLVSPEERACLTLSYAAGMSHADICDITQLPLGTVKSRIHRARQKLQQWLEEHDHPIPTAGRAPATEILNAG